MDDEEKIDNLEKEFEKLDYDQIQEILNKLSINLSQPIEEMIKANIFVIIENDHSVEEIEKEMKKVIS